MSMSYGLVIIVIVCRFATMIAHVTAVSVVETIDLAKHAEQVNGPKGIKDTAAICVLATSKSREHVHVYQLLLSTDLHKKFKTLSPGFYQYNSFYLGFILYHGHQNIS